MKVWLVTVGEPLPVDDNNVRLLRAGIIANLLAKQGHDVTWWTSAFDHYRKRIRTNDHKELLLNNNVKLVLLRSPGYKNNLSLARIYEHKYVAKQFTKHQCDYEKPDVILCSYPTIELSDACVTFANKHHIPVVLDIRDLWPDIFLEVFPGWTRKMVRLLLWPMWKQAKRAMRNATAISATSPNFVQWGCNLAARKITDNDKYFPLGYQKDNLDKNIKQDAMDYWKKSGIYPGDKKFNVCFFGTFGRQFDIETVILAARKIRKDNPNVRFILCGEGEYLNKYRQMADDLDNILFPGWVDAGKIWALMNLSDAGLAPYYNNAGFSDNFPNKTIEYLSAGLPVISSLQGSFRKYLSDSNSGKSYSCGDADLLAEILIGLCVDMDGVKEMSRNALEGFNKYFDANVVYDDMIDYLGGVVKNFESINRGLNR